YKLSLSRALLLAVAGIVAVGGPIVMGVRILKASPRAAAAIAAKSRQAGGRGNGGGGKSLSDMQEYRLGEIKVVGAKLMRSEAIMSSLGIVSDELYNESKLREGFVNLMHLYGEFGYVNFVPQPAFEFDEQKKVMNL